MKLNVYSNDLNCKSNYLAASNRAAAERMEAATVIPVIFP
jgi:hypothetical protein